jgi:hypothetical protein
MAPLVWHDKWAASRNGGDARGIIECVPGRRVPAVLHDPAWRYYEIDASHSPNVTAPEALVRLLVQIVG